MWNFGFDAPYLSKATVITTGEAANLQAQAYQDQWELERLSRTETIPLTNYIELNK